MDGDRKITNSYEIQFTEHHQDALTDLHGVQLAHDSNDDGVLNQEDMTWQHFGIWHDKNNDGITQDDEYQTLDEAGITQLDVVSDGNAYDANGNTIHGEASFTKDDGSTGKIGDVSLQAIITDDQSDDDDNEDDEEEEDDDDEFADLPDYDHIAQLIIQEISAYPIAGSTGDSLPPPAVIEDTSAIIDYQDYA